MTAAAPAFHYDRVERAVAATVSVISTTRLPSGAHRAGYLTTTSVGARWLQIGVAFYADGRPFLYLEAGDSAFEVLAPAVLGRRYCVALLRRRGGYLARLDGRRVGFLRFPRVPTVAAAEGYGTTPGRDIAVSAGCTR